MGRLALMGVGGPGTYSSKVLGYNPIAYWPLWETSGLAAHCLVNAAQDGTYTGVTLADGTGPDGSPCPLFDGANDYVNVQTAALALAFNGAEGSISWWTKVFNAGVWTDGTFRHQVTFWVDAGNQVFFRRHTTNNWLTMWYRAGGTIKQQALTPGQPTIFFHNTLTWSKTADKFQYYFNGGLSGAALTGLGIWAGSVALSVIGAGDLVPSSVWHGWLAHVAAWDRPLLPAEIADLAVA